MLLSVVLLCVVLCSCGKNKEEGNEKAETQATEPTKATEKKRERPTLAPTEGATEEILIVYEDEEDESDSPFADVDKNSSTDDEITDFEYLSQEQDAEWAFGDDTYDDILTCYIKDRLEPNQTMHYLIDLKTGTIYFSSNPGNWYSVNDYSDDEVLTDKQIKELIAAFKDADSQSWKDEETGDNSTCDDLSIIAIEYENGKIERHSIVCKSCGAIKDFTSLVKTISKIAKNEELTEDNNNNNNNNNNNSNNSNNSQESATESPSGTVEEHYHDDGETTVYVYDYMPGDEYIDGYGHIEGYIDGFGYIDGYGVVEGY